MARSALACVLLVLCFSVATLAKEYKTIEEALADRSDLTILNTAVKIAGLQDSLDKSDLEWTMFAPNNQAFGTFFLDKKISVAMLLADKAKLSKLLLNHVVSSRALRAKDLEDGDKLTTESDEKLHVEVRSAADLDKRHKERHVHVVASQGEADVVEANIRAGESIIHVVNRVLEPTGVTSVQRS